MHILIRKRLYFTQLAVATARGSAAACLCGCTCCGAAANYGPAVVCRTVTVAGGPPPFLASNRQLFAGRRLFAGLRLPASGLRLPASEHVFAGQLGGAFEPPSFIFGNLSFYVFLSDNICLCFHRSPGEAACLVCKLSRLCSSGWLYRGKYRGILGFSLTHWFRYGRL